MKGRRCDKCDELTIGEFCSRCESYVCQGCRDHCGCEVDAVKNAMLRATKRSEEKLKDQSWYPE